ncbi:MAG TPA: DUF998 domain-containing protein [Egibacteraceae bacterium]|nr:DUF998 domain-containing protein [Egibacteraceae bacterium]
MSAAAVVRAGVAVAAAAIAALHVLRRDLSPLSDRLSPYAIGPHGWLMAVGFAAMTVALLGTVAVLWRSRRTALDSLFSAVLVGAAVGMALSGVYRVEVSARSDAVHGVASAIAVVGVASAAVWWSLLRPVRRGAPVGVAGWAAGAAGVLVLVSPVLHDGPLTGLGQRALWAAVGLWLLLVPRDGGAKAGRRAT